MINTECQDSEITQEHFDDLKQREAGTEMINNINVKINPGMRIRDFSLPTYFAGKLEKCELAKFGVGRIYFFFV